MGAEEVAVAFPLFLLSLAFTNLLFFFRLAITALCASFTPPFPGFTLEVVLLFLGIAPVEADTGGIAPELGTVTLTGATTGEDVVTVVTASTTVVAGVVVTAAAWA